MEIMIGFTEEQLKEIMDYQEQIKAETVQDAVMIAISGNAVHKNNEYYSVTTPATIPIR